MKAVGNSDVQRPMLNDSPFSPSIAFASSRYLLKADPKELRARQRKLVRSIYRRVLVSSIRGAHVSRTQELVRSVYEEGYSHTNEAYAAGLEGRRDVYRLGNKLVLANGWFIVESYTRLLDAALNYLDARTVLEVGSGLGKNVAILAMRNRSRHFVGLELTRNGVDRATALVHRPPIGFVHCAQADSAMLELPISNAEFVQGTAFQMPFSGSSFDVVFSCLALEQMGSGVERAIEEMSRVTRKHAVFLEPFADANDPAGRLHLRSVDYFRRPINGLRKRGFRPVFKTASLPQKLSFGVAFVIATKL